jgi:hypothetical protein
MKAMLPEGAVRQKMVSEGVLSLQVRNLDIAWIGSQAFGDLTDC